MKPRPLPHRIIATVIAAGAIVLSQATLAAEFWGHRYSSQVNVSYGEQPAQVFDLYLYGQRTGEPDYFAADPAPRPTLIWIHGGGWVAGDKAREIPWLIPYLQQGWNVANVNYRQGPDTAPLAVDDVLCAYQRITEILTAASMPLDQVVVSGASAGGHLALVVGMRNSDGEHPCQVATPPKAIVNWFGITDIEAVHEFLRKTRPETNYAASWIGDLTRLSDISAAHSPLFLVSENTPPIITVHGDRDSVVPFEQATALHESLSTPNRLVTMEGGNHSGFSDTQYQNAYRAIFEFINDL
ncbi:MAG: alpha/beta hydrolase fold domain-containing protein [Pseudomonadales bacterium]